MSRAVLVTGGSRGIGAAIVRGFAERGDRVALHCRDGVAAAEAVRDSLPGQGHVIVRADLTDPEEVRAMVDEAAGWLGGLDVLVNNAGVYGGVPVLGTSYAEWQAAWQATIGLNLTGAANVTWCAVRHMIGDAEAGGAIGAGRAGGVDGAGEANKSDGASGAGSAGRLGGPLGVGGAGGAGRTGGSGGGRIVNVGSRGAYRGCTPSGSRLPWRSRRMASPSRRWPPGTWRRT